MPLSTYGRNVVAMALTGQATLPTSLWLAFTTAIPGADDDGTTILEAANSTRQLIDFTTGWTFPVLGATAYNSPIDIAVGGLPWGTFTAYALCTADTAGSVFAYDYLASAMTANANATLTIPASAFSLQVA